MRHFSRFLLSAAILLLGAAAPTVRGAESSPSVDFDSQVRPILSERCFTCHGPDEGARQASFRLDTKEGAFGELTTGGHAIVAGDPAASVLVERITSDDPVRRMPPSYMGLDKLPEKEIETLRRWIAEGAHWSQHWSFVPPKRPTPPEVSQPEWVRNAIDRFVLARLDQEDLEPSPQADRATLIRRLSLDLTGLPPDPAEVDAFVRDTSANAYEKVVDRLLASPHYGEHMAVAWLDAARYSDTNGYQTDGVRTMWPWRDWVVQAFNRNQPFDQFTIEQIGGDLLPNPTLDQKIATAFNRNNRTTAEGGSVEEEFLAEYAADRVATTSTVWLGLTMGCARCHDHKYDPLKQREFYQLFAYFDNLPERGLVYNFGNDEPTIPAPSPAQQKELGELTRKVEKADAQLASLRGKIARDTKDWAKDLRQSNEPVSWAFEDSLVYYAALDQQDLPFVEPKPDKGKKGTEGDQESETAQKAGDAARKAEAEAERKERWQGPREVALAEGKFGQAAKFEGDRYALAGDVAGFNYNEPFSFSFWIHPEAPDGTILNRMEDAKDPQGLGLFLAGGKLRFELTMRYTDLSMRVVSRKPLAMNQWQHVAVTYTGERPSSSGTRIYLDGRLREFDVEWDDLKWPIPYPRPLRLGSGGGRPSFQGRLDELRIYDRSLNASEIGVLATTETIKQIAALDAKDRSQAQADKLRLAYIDLAASHQVRQAVASLGHARNELKQYEDTIPTVMIMAEEGDKPTHLLKRGAYDMPGELVEPGIPEVLPPLNSEWKNNRLGLARWLVDRDNPLTARVTVNRFWQTLFGVGIVKTVEDFGSQGERPSHPKLLDWLAVEFMDSGWDVKGILKKMVMSATYRQSSKTRPDLIERDPENRLLARGIRFRLPAETIRDQALAASGLLNDDMGGPPVKPYQPPGLWSEVSSGEYERDSGEALYRRSLYTYWRRTVPPPEMTVFDAADRETCRVQRARTNTPLQALTLMNDVTFVEASRKLAERMISEGGMTSEERLEHGFRLVNSRRPDPKELELLKDTLGRFENAYQKDTTGAEGLLQEGEAPTAPGIETRQLAAYTAIASLLLNTDEAVTKE